MEEPIKVERFGKEVWETPYMDGMRKYSCLCLHCENMKPGEPDHCPAAAAFYEICKKYGNAFVMTRCSIWKPKKET